MLPSNQEAGMMCTVNRETFYIFTKNTLISNSVTLCHITNNNMELYDVTKMNMLVQGSSDSRSMENLLHMRMRQVVRMIRCMFYGLYI